MGGCSLFRLPSGKRQLQPLQEFQRSNILREWLAFLVLTERTICCIKVALKGNEKSQRAFAHAEGGVSDTNRKSGKNPLSLWTAQASFYLMANVEKWASQMEKRVRTQALQTPPKQTNKGIINLEITAWSLFACYIQMLIIEARRLWWAQTVLFHLAYLHNE